MRKLIGLLVLFILGCSSSHAQTRVQIGVAGGLDFDNKNFGATVGIEAPFLKHYELDLQDTFSPLESHTGLGGGYSNLISGEGHIWLTNRFGVNGRVDDSSYGVTHVTKDALYAFGGISYRGLVGGFPSRFSIDYIRQFNNGVTPSGLESSHLQGVNLEATVRIGCAGPGCFRFTENLNFGRVLEQGNPSCDGSIGMKTCGDRRASVGGGMNGSITFEFPRRRGYEYDAF